MSHLAGKGFVHLGGEGVDQRLQARDGPDKLEWHGADNLVIRGRGLVDDEMLSKVWLDQDQFFASLEAGKAVDRPVGAAGQAALVWHDHQKLVAQVPKAARAGAAAEGRADGDLVPVAGQVLRQQLGVKLPETTQCGGFGVDDGAEKLCCAVMRQQICRQIRTLFSKAVCGAASFLMRSMVSLSLLLCAVQITVSVLSSMSCRDKCDRGWQACSGTRGIRHRDMRVKQVQAYAGSGAGSRPARRRVHPDMSVTRRLLCGQRHATHLKVKYHRWNGG